MQVNKRAIALGFWFGFLAAAILITTLPTHLRIITECERTLTREQECVLVAVPKTALNAHGRLMLPRGVDK